MVKIKDKMDNESNKKLRSEISQKQLLPINNTMK